MPSPTPPVLISAQWEIAEDIAVISGNLKPDFNRLASLENPILASADAASTVFFCNDETYSGTHNGLAHEYIEKRLEHRSLALLIAKSAHQAACFCFSSRSSRRKILPTLVFGKSSRNSIYFGRL